MAAWRLGLQRLLSLSDALALCASRSYLPTALPHVPSLPAICDALLNSPLTTRHFGFAATAAAPLHEFDTYKVTVVTGNLRGAGTHSPAWVQLIGSNGSTERYMLGDEDTFERDTAREFTLPVPKNIGQLRRVHIQKRRQPQALGDGWYLKHVEVSGPGGDSVVFPCNAWLGESDCGGYNGPNERNLLPAALQSPVVEYPEPVKLTASGMAIPHPEKLMKGGRKGVNTRGYGHAGEDAYFFGKGSKLFGMGVADGIYAWKEQGIDAGLMSRALMERCKALVEADNEDVFQVLGSAVQAVHDASLQGSSTVCLLAVDTTTGQLHSANLGDSGFLVFGPVDGPEEFELKFRTNQLEHSFGCPYQVGHQATANKVEDCDLASFHVHPGDVIVMGSDGLLDNVADLEILAEIKAMVHQGGSANSLTQRLTKLAFDTSVNKVKVTPYSKGASEAFDMVYSGGKPDDITVLVALVH
ncbi:hypothetical protein V8C86DRAFT_2623890 [Haematococcus lacustris]